MTGVESNEVLKENALQTCLFCFGRLEEEKKNYYVENLLQFTLTSQLCVRSELLPE